MKKQGICPCCRRPFVPPQSSTQKSPTFGELIAEALNRVGMPQVELARRLNTSQGRVSEMLKTKSLTERTLKKCVKALGLKLEVRLK